MKDSLTKKIILSMKKIVILSAIVLIGYFQSRAQNVLTAPLTWSVTQLTNLNNSASQPYTATFKTNGSQDITWIQKGGQYVTTLSASGVTGTWPDIKAAGKVQYNVSSGSQTGTLTFERNTTGLLITLDLSQPTGNRLRHKYTVSKVE